MKRIIISFVVAIIISVPLIAQKKIIFSSKNYFGITSGENGTNPKLQTINGFRIGKWFTGIGTGIDWYYQRSIPLFLSADRYFSIKPRRSFLISGDAGINFPWKQDNYYNYWNYYDNSKMTPGFYWATGLGYRIGVGKQNDALLLHVGYINKLYKEKSTYTVPCLIAPCPVNEESFNYNLKGVSIKIGYGF
jgi:hypothetical protein